MREKLRVRWTIRLGVNSAFGTFTTSTICPAPIWDLIGDPKMDAMTNSRFTTSRKESMD